MSSTDSPTPSEHALRILKYLKEAVSEELERKRRLGHYAVVWDGEKPVKIGGDELLSDNRK